MAGVIWKIFGSQGGGPPGVEPYDYGYPAGLGGGVQPDVLAQWIFNEASGNILDQAGSVDLTPTLVGSAGLSYGVPIGYSDPTFELVSPGVFFLSKTSNAYYLESSSTTLAPGTGDFTIEWIAQYINKNNLNSTGAIFSTVNNSVEQGLCFYYDNAQSVTCRFEMYLKATDGTLFYLAGNITTNPFTDMKIHKHRIVLDRAGDAQYYIDGVLQLSGSMAAVAGKNFPASQLQVLAVTTSGLNSLCATMFEMRVSGNSVNNSGGPGGG